MKPLGVAMETQLLSSYEILGNAVNNIKLHRSSRKVPDFLSCWNEIWCFRQILVVVANKIS
jgi:hypothetical protein